MTNNSALADNFGHQFQLSRNDQMMTNEFAFLPKETINDIVELAGVERTYEQARTHHEHLVQLDGPWGDFARYAAPIMLITNKFVTRNCKRSRYSQSADIPLTIQGAGNRRISHSEIEKNVDVNVLRKVAPHLEESIKFRNAPKIPSDVLDMIGNRFSCVEWSDYGDRPLAIQEDMAQFLKRQLRSNYLRTFIFRSDLIDNGELNDLFIEFVKRPTFKSLIGRTGTYISSQVVIAAHQAWLSRRSFEVGTQEIRGFVTPESLSALTAQVEITWDRKPHPSVPSASDFVFGAERMADNHGVDAYCIAFAFFNKFVE